MILLDTNIVSLLHSGDPDIVKRVKGIKAEEVATTIITEVEILRARYDFVLKASDASQLSKAQAWLDTSKTLLKDMNIVPITEAAAREFDRLRAFKGLRRIGRADLLIACIALSLHAKLVTRNVRDFERVPGLRIENWAD
jgi:tRNA(fMet)-specific endonuclease VapC